jgi:hypothetical protein
MAHGNGHGSGNGHGNGHGNGTGHETKDTGPGLIVYSAIGLTIGTAIICLIVWGLFNLLKYEEPPAPRALMENPATIPPEPRLQVDPTIQFKDLRAHEEHVLGTYAWVDQKSGTVRVPIDKAMDLLAQRGLPTRDFVKNPPPPKPAAAKPRGPAQASLGVSSAKQ